MSGLLGLFGGSDDPPPAPLVKYAMPQRVSFEAAESADGMRNVDYDQAGTPRAYSSNGSSESWYRSADHGECAGDGRTVLS